MSCTTQRKAETSSCVTANFRFAPETIRDGQNFRKVVSCLTTAIGMQRCGQRLEEQHSPWKTNALIKLDLIVSDNFYIDRIQAFSALCYLVAHAIILLYLID